MTLRDIANALKDDLLIEVMERIVELKPDDFDTRFWLAYKHSEKERNDMALFHYLQIPPAGRNPITWNNLGASFQQFSMPGKAVEAYRTSAESGETLAMSNIGYKLMHAGFLNEAEEEFKKALKIESFHGNVGEGIAALRSLPDEEDVKQKDVLEKAKPKIDYFRRLGRAIARPAVTKLSNRWYGPDCELAVTIIDDEFRASGEYERSGNAFGLMLAAVKPTRHKIEYVGKVVGCRVDGFIQRTSDGEPPSLLSSLAFEDNKTKFAMIMDPDVGRIEVIEDPASLSPRFHELKVFA